MPFEARSPVIMPHRVLLSLSSLLQSKLHI